MPSLTAGWEGDDFVLRDGPAERARLHEVGGALPTAPELAGVEGWWWCPSAAVTLRVIESDGGWMLQRGQSTPEPLQPAGDRDGRWVLAAPWGLVELDHDGLVGRVVLHRAEGLAVHRLAALDTTP
jgi:hypothetical protein